MQTFSRFFGIVLFGTLAGAWLAASIAVIGGTAYIIAPYMVAISALMHLFIATLPIWAWKD